MEKISIIIPIYNQEKYLTKCLKSIAAQNYQEFEVLMVDDGSFDDSGNICRNFEKTDSRFKYIWQNNAGVASARNTGLDYVTGDLIGFIDPDDWVAPNFYERLVELYHQYRTDIVSCGRLEVNDGETVGTQAANYAVKVCTKEQAVALLTENTAVKSHLWNRIYVPDVWDGIRFEDGRVYEDVWVLHQVFDKANTFVFTDEPLYFYRQHPISIVRAVSLRKQIDHCYAHQCRYTYLSGKYPSTKTNIVRNYGYEVIGLVDAAVASNWKEVIQCKRCVEKIINDYSQIDDSILRDRKIILMKKNVFLAVAYYKVRKWLKK